jgi:4-alpha-glucanotransferase
VLYFARGARGFRASRRYSRRALVTANTHDLPPLAGFVRGRDLELRRRVGAIGSDRELAAAQAERAASCRALAKRLAAEGILDAGEPLPAPPRLSATIHAFLSRTPAPLVGLALDDLAGESEPVNLPGIGPDRFPSWRRRMACSLEEIPPLLSGLAGDARAVPYRDPSARQRG